MAATCPEPPDFRAETDALFSELRRAPDAAAAQEISDRLWIIWSTAPDAHAQTLLDEGMWHIGLFDLEGAIARMDALIAYCPDFAEGYNQRAFAQFLAGDYRGALDDLERAIELSPRHVGALSGKALTLMGLGEQERGEKLLREALRLNPWLPERQLLPESGGVEL